MFATASIALMLPVVLTGMPARRDNMPFTKKPYREASFRHADISNEIKTPWADRLYRKIFRRDLLDDNGSHETTSRRFGVTLKIAAALLAGWVIFETILAWNIFE